MALSGMSSSTKESTKKSTSSVKSPLNVFKNLASSTNLEKQNQSEKEKQPLQPQTGSIAEPCESPYPVRMNLKPIFHRKKCAIYIPLLPMVFCFFC